MRPLFSDGANSFWHVIFGILSVKYTFIMPIFLAYQLIKHNPISTSFAGISEFIVGYLIGLVLKRTSLI
jgi:hypothetical protein